MSNNMGAVFLDKIREREKMVERVAQAIYNAENPSGRLWSDRADGTLGTYLYLARTAIAEIEQTHTLVSRGHDSVLT